MQVLIYYEGAGEGCGYTIGCNQDVSVVTAESMDDVAQWIIDDLIHPDRELSICLHRLKELDKVTLYAIADYCSLNLKAVCEAKTEIDARHTAEQKEQEERALYETLKVKFGEA